MKKTLKRIYKKVKHPGGDLPFFYKRYNNTLGYFTNEKFIRYLKKNQDTYRQSDDPLKDRLRDSVIPTQGTQLLRNVLDLEKANRLSQRMSELIAEREGLQVKEEVKHLTARIEKPVTVLGREVIDIFHNEQMDLEIKSFFGGSFYRIEWLNCYRSFPSNDPKSSWLWHSDNVPTGTLKIMLHLTDAGRDRGATQFLPIVDTMEYRAKGYFGIDPKSRLENLQSFADRHGIPFRPSNHEAKAGDVLLFLNNTLHRAVPPKAEHRDVLTYLLLPNPIPWDQQLAKDGLEMIEEEPGSYPTELWR
ncbi:MAG: phytanoyl-CoA dioxygenase family protein [Bacteroidota bacterium]